MQAEIVQDDWARIETSAGGWSVPLDVLPKWFMELAAGEEHDFDDLGTKALAAARTYVEGEPESIKIERRKWGARLSAPGYTDCTEWCVFDTEKEAHNYLVETYELCRKCLSDDCEEGCDLCDECAEKEEMAERK